jgi:hypothetical protein
VIAHDEFPHLADAQFQHQPAKIATDFATEFAGTEWHSKDQPVAKRKSQIDQACLAMLEWAGTAATH